MAQRIVEMLIGRLTTDEQFRSAFLRDPQGTLTELRNCGLELTLTEVSALIDTAPDVWAHTAERLDPRLQKASLLIPVTPKASTHHD